MKVLFCCLMLHWITDIDVTFAKPRCFIGLIQGFKGIDRHAQRREQRGCRVCVWCSEFLAIVWKIASGSRSEIHLCVGSFYDVNENLWGIDETLSFLFFFNTVHCPGHRALPRYLPHRPHNAGHGGQRQARCKSLSSLSGGKSWSQPLDVCSIFYNYWSDITHPVTPFAERLHQLWQKEKGECCNVNILCKVKRSKLISML